VVSCLLSGGVGGYRSRVARGSWRRSPVTSDIATRDWAVSGEMEACEMEKPSRVAVDKSAKEAIGGGRMAQPHKLGLLFTGNGEVKLR